MKKVLHQKYSNFESDIDQIIQTFDHSGVLLGGGERNKIKVFELDGKPINVKAFKIPNLINRISYRFIRKSKAQRSFEYAKKLVELGIGTPQPIAYYEFPSLFLYKKSFYVSAHQEYDLTYRELSRNLEYPNHESILRAFTRFTYELHENKVLFLDHSPGNTLITKKDGGYQFSLVDLNRMVFKTLTFKERIRNFERLTIHKSMVHIMSDEYAKCIGEPYDKVFELMWRSTQKFQEKFHRKKRIKKKLKFWK